MARRRDPCAGIQANDTKVLAEMGRGDDLLAVATELDGASDLLHAAEILSECCKASRKEVLAFRRYASARKLIRDAEVSAGAISPFPMTPSGVRDALGVLVKELPAVPVEVLVQQMLVVLSTRRRALLGELLQARLADGPIEIRDGAVLPLPNALLLERTRRQFADLELAVSHVPTYRETPLGESALRTVRVPEHFKLMMAGTSTSRLFHGIPTIATFQPIADPAIESEVFIDRRDGIFNVSARDGQELARRYRAALEMAADKGVNVFVGPEFMAPNTDMAVDLLRSLDRPPPELVVLGSVHREAEGGWRNECDIFVNGEHVTTNAKLTPFEDKTLGIENIVAGDMLTVVQIDGWRIATAICSDINDLGFCDMVRSLSVNILLVPTWTTKSGAFPERLGGIGVESQAFTVLSNGPLPADRIGSVEQSIVWRPFRPSSSESNFDPELSSLTIFDPVHGGHESYGIQAAAGS